MALAQNDMRNDFSRTLQGLVSRALTLYRQRLLNPNKLSSYLEHALLTVKKLAGVAGNDFLHDFLKLATLLCKGCCIILKAVCPIYLHSPALCCVCAAQELGGAAGLHERPAR